MTYTINDIKREMRAAGSHWFDPDTMRFFGTKVLNSTVYQGPGGVYFVTSEWDGFRGRDENKRAYTVRKFDPATADIDTIGDVCGYKYADDAVKAASELAGGGEVVREQFEPVSDLEQFVDDCRKHGKPTISNRSLTNIARSLMTLAAEHHGIMEDYCNGSINPYTANGDPKGRLKNVRGYIEANALAAGAKGVHFQGDPRGCTVKIIWNDGATNDLAKDGWCVPTA